MQQNKNYFPQSPIEYNIFRNDRPKGWQKHRSELTTDIITHQFIRHHHSTILPNPEKSFSPLSYRKSIPLNSEVLKERSQMIAHPSKISKDVPVWFRGDTYKYYSKNEYQNLYNKNDLYTIDYPTKTLINKPISDLSEPGTPRSRGSSDSDNFYFGGGGNEVQIRRPYRKRLPRQISSKIGSVQKRNFQLPRIPLKIGHSQYINTHKAC